MPRIACLYFETRNQTETPLAYDDTIPLPRDGCVLDNHCHSADPILSIFRSRLTGVAPSYKDSTGLGLITQCYRSMMPHKCLTLDLVGRGMLRVRWQPEEGIGDARFFVYQFHTTPQSLNHHGLLDAFNWVP
jgi:hypothetical protein